MTAQDTPPEVAVVVVTHDTRELALRCVSTLEPAGADEIVVVDTGSSDGTAEALAATHPDVEVVVLPNVGYGRGANAGAVRTAAPVLVVANADTEFPPGSLEGLRDAVTADPGIGAAGPRVRYPDGRPQASARRFPSLGVAAGHALLGLWWPDNPWTRRYRMRDVDPDRPTDVDWLSGCVIALRREAFEAVGGFDRDYFMFVEDVDLGYRLRRAGWRVRYDPRVTVIHHVGASTDAGGPAMVVAHARSLDRFYGRVYATGTGRLLRPLVRLGLVAWVLLVIAWNRWARVRAGRSRTGE